MLDRTPSVGSAHAVDDIRLLTRFTVVELAHRITTLVSLDVAADPDLEAIVDGVILGLWPGQAIEVDLATAARARDHRRPRRCQSPISAASQMSCGIVDDSTGFASVGSCASRFTRPLESTSG